MTDTSLEELALLKKDILQKNIYINILDIQEHRFNVKTRTKLNTSLKEHINVKFTGN